ncbi:MAG: aminopeptidase P N-terminal domain-containing protein [Sandaracinaceae bacterium]
MASTTYAGRRERLLAALPEGAVAVLPSQPTALRNHDVEHAYRQHSDLFYLTGLDEPQSVLVLTTVHPEHHAVLFLRERNPEREMWDGARAGVDGAKGDLGLDEAFPIHELDRRLPDYLEGATTLLYAFGEDPAFDVRLGAALRTARSRHRKGKAYPTRLIDPALVLHEQRLRKSADELRTMARAAEVTREAHLAAMRIARPGLHEYEVEAELRRVFLRGGSQRVAYDPIVGSGPNATVLHYRRNDRRMEDGDLLLIDAGAEVDYYACDVTRTFPVNGRFTAEQRAIYDLVLEAQTRAIDAVRPGATVEDVHDVSLRTITEGLVDLGLVEGPVDDAVAEERYKTLFPHRTSHWLGMDVHDVGLYFVDGEARPLEAGFILTVEPGVYVPLDADVEERWRGIGVRIEDDVLVTEDGHESMTAAIPKSPEAMEKLAREQP